MIPIGSTIKEWNSVYQASNPMYDKSRLQKSFRSIDNLLNSKKIWLEGKICSETVITQTKGFEPLRRASF